MYPKNNASPPRLAIGQVVQISDGAIQSSAVVITVRGEGAAEATGGGTTAYGADGTVYYTPTQAETNYTAFVVIASKASCYSTSITVVTTATAVPGTVDIGSVSGSTASADNLELSAGTIVSGAAIAGTLSTTQMTTNLTEVTDDHYNGRVLIWTSGVLQDQATDITDYTGSTKLLTYTAVTEAPTATDSFIIV